MKSWVVRVRNERGVALPLALFTLVSLSAFVLAFLSMSGMEPQVSRNLSDSSQARYAAEAGLESAYDQLSNAPGTGQGSWTNLLQTNPVARSNPQAAWLTGANGAQVTLPGLTANFGTYTVQIRNDVLATDTAMTGLAPDTGGATNDTNGTVVVTASGIYNGVQRQIQAVMRRVSLPPFPGAYSMPGVQADLWFANSTFNIDGRDYLYQCTANCNDPNPANKVYGYVVNSDQSKMKFGVAVQPGYQQNMCSGACDGVKDTTYEQRAEFKLDTPPKQGNVIGKNQIGGNLPTTGLTTVAPDPGLNPTVMQSFLTQLAKFSGTTVIQSTIACAQNIGGVPVGILMQGNAANPSQPTLTNACGMNQKLDLGDKNNPKLVYFRGDLDPSSAFAGVVMDGAPLKGAGILVVEDGDLRFRNQFDWDGIVIVTGRYVSSIFEGASKVNIYGATVSNETVWDEGGATNQNTFWDGWFQSANAVNLRNSQQMLNMVQRSLLFRMSTWREI